MKTKGITEKQLFTKAIRQHIDSKDWDRLADAMISAGKVGVAPTLQKKAWIHIAEYRQHQGNHAASVIAFNSARSLAVDDKRILEKMLASLQNFYRAHDSDFSREDLLRLQEPLDRLINYYVVHRKSRIGNLQQATELKERIALRMVEAPSKEETPATYEVEEIRAALYPSMTIEEVRAEFARIVEPLIRERLARRPQTSSSGGAKGPKLPKDTDKKNPPPKETPKTTSTPPKKLGRKPKKK